MRCLAEGLGDQDLGSKGLGVKVWGYRCGLRGVGFRVSGWGFVL